MKFAHLAEKSEKGSISNFSTKLKTADGGDDLGLPPHGQAAPSFEGPHLRQAFESDALPDLARESDVVDVHEEADHRRHRNTTVLDLGVAEEFKRPVAAGGREV